MPIAEELCIRQALTRAGITVGRQPAGGIVVGGSRSGKSAALCGVGREFGDGVLRVSGVLRSADLVFGSLLDGVVERRELRWIVAERIAERGYRALLVDDAGLLDREAAAVVHALVVHDRLPVYLACAAGVSGVDPAVVSLWKDGHLPRHDLPLLGGEDVEEYLAALLPQPPAARDVEFFTWWSGGQPALLVDLVAESIRAECWSVVHSSAVLVRRPRPGPALLDLLDGELASLPDGARTVLEILTAASSVVDDHTRGWLPLEAVLALADLDALIDAERRGLIQVDGDRVRLRARYVGDWVSARVPSLRLRALAGRLADLIGASPAQRTGDDRTVVTALLGLGALDAPPRSATAAVRSALRLGDPQSVLAIATDGGADPLAQRAGPEVAAAAAWAALHLGDLALFTGLLRVRADDTGPHWAGLRVLAAAAAQWIGDGAAAESALGAGSPDDPAPTVAPVVDAIAADRLSGAWLGLLVGVAATLRGRIASARQVLAAALPAAADDGLLHFYLSLLQVHLDLFAGAGDAVAHADRTGTPSEWHSDHLRAAADFSAATARMAAGRFDEAAELLRGAIPLLATDGWRIAAVRMLDRLSMMQTGLAPEPAPGLLTQPASLPLEISALAIDCAWRAAVDGRDAEAVGILPDTAETLADSAPLLNIEHLELAARFLAAPVVGDLGRRLATGAAALATMPEAPPRVLLLAEHVAALGSADGDRLDRVAAAHLAAGRLPVAADVAAQAAAAHAGRGAVRSAAVGRATAEGLIARIGGLRSPAQRRLAGSGGLTVRERQVVALVAESLTNKEIAERLKLSVRTVEGHLLRACTKCGVSSRREMAEYWRSRDR